MYKQIAKETLKKIKNASGSFQVRQIINNQLNSIPSDHSRREWLNYLKNFLLIKEKQDNEQALRNMREARRIIDELMKN